MSTSRVVNAGVNGLTQLTGDVAAGPGSGNAVATVQPAVVTNAKLANMAAHTVKANITGSSAAPVDSSLSAILDAEVGSAVGTLLVRGTSVWSPFPVGSNTQLIVADSTQTLGMKWSNAPAAAGITVGLDKDRPAASAGVAFYQTTDSLVLYSSDAVSKWLVAGSGPDKVAYGPFTDSNYIQSSFVVTSGAGPTMSNPYTICIGFYLNSLPGATSQIFFVNMQGNGTDGFYISTSAANSNKLKFFMRGVNSNAENEFSGMTALTTGAHSVAISYDGSNLVLVCDGGSAQTIATTGTYTVPAANALTKIGRYTNTGNAFTAGLVSYVYGYASALSTGDKQTLTTTPSNFRPGAVSTAPAWVFAANMPTTGNQLRTWGSAINTDGTSNMSVQGAGLHINTF